MSIGDNIKKWRELRNLKQSELAELLGVSDKTISSWEINRTEPKMGMVEKISIALNCKKTDIIGIDENEKPALTARDERDIAKDLDRIMNEIKNGDDGPLYYNGVEIDDASINLLQNAIEYALRETKKENKVKYNPNKNKK